MPSLTIDPNPTLSFSLGVKGWPSFYSYKPEFMMGMNNYFYSWSGGNLYRHNSNSVNRNNFYGANYDTEVITVFNDAPVSNLLWKTIHLEGTDPWYAELQTDLNTGLVETDWFVKKEGAWFAFLRNEKTSISDYITNEGWMDSRSIIGIGTGTVSVGSVVFTTADVPYEVSVGDYLFNVNASANPESEAQITDIVRTATQEVITVDSSPWSIGQTYYFATYKNFQAESTGMIGHYNYIKLTNSKTTPTELFAVEAEVMASFPYP